MIHEVCNSAVLRSAVLLHDVLQGVVDDHGAQVALYLRHDPADRSPRSIVVLDQGLITIVDHGPAVPAPRAVVDEGALIPMQTH